MLIELKNKAGEGGWLDALAIDLVAQAYEANSLVLGQVLVHQQGAHGSYAVQGTPAEVVLALEDARSKAVFADVKLPRMVGFQGTKPGEVSYYPSRQVAAIFQATVQGAATVGRSLLQLHGVQGTIEVDGTPAENAARVNAARLGTQPEAPGAKSALVLP